MLLLSRNINGWLPAPWFRSCQSDASRGGVQLAYLRLGKDVDHTRPPLLTFHGLFGNKNNFRSLLNQISARTRQPAYSFDLRNHGESPHVDGHQSDMLAMATDIKLFMDQNQIVRADLLGHSLGGRVVSQFAFVWPERVNKLILADITPLSDTPVRIDFLTAPDFWETLERSVQEVSPGSNLSEARQQIKRVLSQKIESFTVDFFLMSLYQDSNGGRYRWRYNVSALRKLVEDGLLLRVNNQRPFTGKSLLIYGGKSPYVQESHFDRIRALLPNVRFVCIPDAGHNLHIEKSQQFIDHVVEFLQQQD